jgi:dihydrofolate reductase
MRISHIVAMSENHIIGCNGRMPWHIPEDFKFFKATTMGHAMIMGRKTWESIGRILPGRLTIIVTRSPDFQAPEGAVIKDSLESALQYCRDHQNTWGDECFIVGGGEIYKQSLAIVDRVYLTVVHKVIEGDTAYPVLPTSAFKQIDQAPHLDAPVPFTFTTWDRVQSVKQSVMQSVKQPARQDMP